MIHQYLIPSYYSSVSNVFSSVWVDPSKIWHRYIFDQKILIELNKHQSRLAPLSVFNVCMLECVCRYIACLLDAIAEVTEDIKY